MAEEEVLPGRPKVRRPIKILGELITKIETKKEG